MNVDEAHAAIDNIAPLVGVARARAHWLITNPDLINQGPFGVCAMTCAVRSLLEHDRAKFVGLLNTVFAQVPFHGIAVTPTLQNDLRTLAAAAPGRAKAEDLDFLLPRALGFLFAAVDPVSFQAQMEFSKRFNPAFGETKGEAVELFALAAELDDSLDAAAAVTKAAVAGPAVNVASQPLRKALEENQNRFQHQCGYGIDLVNLQVAVTATGWELTFVVDMALRTLTVTRSRDGAKLLVSTTRTGMFYEEGHLAVDLDGIEVLLKKVVGFPRVTTSTSNLDYAIGKINDLFVAGPNPFVYAGINSFGEFSQAKANLGAPVPYTNPPGPIYSYYGKPAPHPEHWVSVTGQITQVGGNYHLPVWTWARAFTIVISEAQLPNYIHRFVYGSVAA